MKNVKILLSAALVFVGATALAQDFSAPQYEKWGDTPEQREKNILNSNFLKESCDNRDYNAAAHYLNELINSVPTASVSFYQRGAVIYKNKINRRQERRREEYVYRLADAHVRPARQVFRRPSQAGCRFHSRSESTRVPALQAQRPQGYP